MVDAPAPEKTGENENAPLLTTGALKRRGSNDYSQVGDGTNTNRSSPVAITALGTGLKAAPGCGGRVCSIRKPNGSMYYWGGNMYGTYGNGTTTDSLNPIQVNS